MVEFLLQLQTDREVTNTSVDWFNKLATDVSNILENRTFKYSLFSPIFSAVFQSKRFLGFRQALLKKLESNIVPLFAGILSQLDIAFNCSLLDCRTNTWQSQLFLELFRCKDLVNFRFRSSVFFSAGEFPQPLDKFCIPQPSSLDFNCRFPFSWLLKKKVDEFLTIQEKMVRGRCENQKLFSFPLFTEFNFGLCTTLGFVNQTSVELEPVELTDLNEQDGMESLNEDEEDSKMETNEASVLADSHTILERTVWGKILVDLSEHQLRDYLHDLVYWSFRITSHEQSEVNRKMNLVDNLSRIFSVDYIILIFLQS